MDLLETLTWPLGNIIRALSLSVDPVKRDEVQSDILPFLDWYGHLQVISGSFRAFLMAYFVVYFLYADGEYPAYQSKESLEIDWIFRIFRRNILATWILCGFWDWFLYYSPLKNRLSPFKWNAEYPTLANWIHDATWTTISSSVASGIECLFCFAGSKGVLNISSRSLLAWNNVLWIALSTHLRTPHFYISHRLMHPWGTRAYTVAGVEVKVPDVGKFLYKNVHYLHHKSFNPTAMSGTSMHPVESALYYSAAVLPMLCNGHPVIVLTCLIDCAVGAWLGHDGFNIPYGMNDDFHSLHHSHRDCNYGTSIDGIDSLVGTFASSAADFKRKYRHKSK